MCIHPHVSFTDLQSPDATGANIQYPELISEEFQWLHFKDLQKLHKVSEALAQDVFQL